MPVGEPAEISYGATLATAFRNAPMFIVHYARVIAQGVNHSPGYFIEPPTLAQALAALAASGYPKLLFVGDPGTLVSPAYAKAFAAALRSVAVVHLGSGRHNLQEDHPEAIGRTVAGWIAGVEAATSHAPRQVA